MSLRHPACIYADAHKYVPIVCSHILVCAYTVCIYIDVHKHAFVVCAYILMCVHTQCGFVYSSYTACCSVLPYGAVRLIHDRLCVAVCCRVLQ